MASVVWIAALAGCSGRTGEAVVAVTPVEGEGPKREALCSSAGYCWDNPPQGAAFMNGVWGTAPDNVYAVGVGGGVFHHDGVSWKTEPSGTGEWLNGIWGSGPDDVYAMADGGTVIHRKAGAWSTVDVGTTSSLQAAWGTAADDVYLVGDGGTIVRFDGREWSPESSGTNASLRAIWGSGRHDVYAVGYRGGQSQGVVVHYDGASWSDQSVGSSLCGVWGTGPDAVWIAGADDQGNTALWKLSGSEWKPVRVPKAGRATALTGVNGAPVILGLLDLPRESDDFEFGKTIAFALEERGGLFQRRDLITVSRPIAQPRWGIWADGKGGATVTGWWGIAGRLDASGFHPQTGNAALGKHLFGVAGTSASDVVAVGALGAMLRWDGKTWSADPAGKDHDFTGIHAADGAMAATGRGGLLLERRNGRWATVETGTLEDLWAAWVSGDQVFVVGDKGLILGCKAGRCGLMPSGTRENLWSIWGKSPDEIYVTGEKGTLLRFDGTSWKMQPLPGKDGVKGIGPDGAGGVLATSYNMTYRLEKDVWRRAADGGAWAMTDGSDGEIRAVYGGGGAAVGVRRWDGKKWQEEALLMSSFELTAAHLGAIWSGGGEVFVVGDGGAILHKRP